MAEVSVGDAFTRVIAISRAVADRSQYWSGSDLRKATGSDDRQTVTSSKLPQFLTFIGGRSHPTRRPTRHLASRRVAVEGTPLEDCREWRRISGRYLPYFLPYNSGSGTLRLLPPLTG